MMQSRSSRKKTALPGARAIDRGTSSLARTPVPIVSTATLNRVMPAIEAVIQEQGCELLGIERLPEGMLRITLDRIEGVRIEDCETVTRQLLRMFEVEEVGFGRLEVSSPGVDRPLKRFADFVRFAGQPGKLKLRNPLNGRRVYQGIWAVPQDDVLGLTFDTDNGETQLITFTLDEVEAAQLIPQLDFGSKKR